MFNFIKPTNKADSESSTPPIPETETSPSETTRSLEQTPDEDVPSPVSEPKAAQEPQPNPIPADKPLYPPLPTQQPRRSPLTFLLGPETSVGRFMRPLLRWLAAVTGFFALGLLAGYIMIYQPTQRELDAAQLSMPQTTPALTQKDQTLQASQSSSEQAQQNLKLAQTQLSKAASENGLLVVLVGISNARVSLVTKDGPAAKIALEQAQADLAVIYPYISGLDLNNDELLKSRLDLAAKELVTDPTAALSDLDKLAVDLADLHQKLFK